VIIFKLIIYWAGFSFFISGLINIIRKHKGTDGRKNQYGLDLDKWRIFEWFLLPIVIIIQAPIKIPKYGIKTYFIDFYRVLF